MNHPQTPPHGAQVLSVISRLKAGAWKHVGILLPDGRVVHCAPGRGEHVSSIEEFAMGHDIDIIEEIPRHLHGAILKSIAGSIRTPQGYHATTNNFEMFVNRVLGRSAHSSQLNGALLIASFAALIGLAAAA
jgi:hypothetical protein